MDGCISVNAVDACVRLAFVIRVGTADVISVVIAGQFVVRCGSRVIFCHHARRQSLPDGALCASGCIPSACALGAGSSPRPRLRLVRHMIAMIRRWS